MILNGSTNVRNVIQMALELQFFLKHNKKSPSGGGLCPQTLVCNMFKLHLFTRHLSQFTIFWKLFKFWFKFWPPLAKSWLHGNPGFWSSILLYLCPIKNSFWKVLMTSLLCDLAPLIKNPSCAYDADHPFEFCLQVFPLAGPSKHCG